MASNAGPAPPVAQVSLLASRMVGAPLVQVDELWRAAFQHGAGVAPQRTPDRWALVLRHSFAVQAVFEVANDQPGACSGAPDALPRHRQLIGFARYGDTTAMAPPKPAVHKCALSGMFVNFCLISVCSC